jgi:hypothetical protein
MNSSRKEQEMMFNEWYMEIGTDYLYNFIDNGLRPFCKEHGYSLVYSTKECVALLRKWAFSHVYSQRKKKYVEWSFTPSFNEPGFEEWDWYCHSIDTTSWLNFAKKCALPEFLDDSDAGRSQVCDLANCVWTFIDLETSSAHKFWLNNIYNDGVDDDQGYVHHQEEYAYGGDRRTY